MIYRHFDHRGLQTLRDGMLKVSSPEDFNDPFDCLTLERREVPDTMIDDMLANPKFLAAVKEFGFDSFPKEEQRRIARRMSKITSPDAMRKHLGNRGKICCFTKEPLNILMWSHYSASHRGMLLGFDERYFKSGLHAVEYSDTRPENPVPFIEDNEAYKKLLLTKALDWSYEKEVRILVAVGAYERQGDNYFFPFPRESVKIVLMGCRAPNDLVSDVESLVCDLYPHAKFGKASLSPHLYALESELIQNI